MIKFFRNIRKKLAEQNKVATYLRYAIGEIVLVVIGILIALQVNNLNQERKERILEADYYCRLLEDVNHDILELKNQLDINELRIKSSNKFIHLLQQPTFTQKEIMDAMLGSISKTTFTFKPSMATFEDLKSSGNLGLLKDLSIKNKLIAYYVKLDGLIDVIDVNSDKSISLFFSDKNDFGAIGWQYLPFVETQIDTSLVDVKSLTPKDYPSESLRKQLMNYAIMFLGTSSRKKDLYLIIAEEIHAMQDILNKKCNND
jgi:hypothetical protein